MRERSVFTPVTARLSAPVALGILVSCIIASCFLLSCGEDSTTGTGTPEDFTRETPEDLLLTFAHALEERDIDIYDECLADSYQYEFVGSDYKQAGVNQVHPWWDKDDDTAAAESMFSDTLVNYIEAEFEIDDAMLASGLHADAVPVGGIHSAGDSTLRVDISVAIEVEDIHGGDPTTYWANSSWLYVTVAPDESDSTLWQIKEIKEVAVPASYIAGTAAGEGRGATGGVSAGAPCTFGRIKAMFRHRQECELKPRCSPECLLKAYEWALIYKDIDAYSECLHDEYLFEFDEVDYQVAGVSGESPWWGKTQDEASMHAMLTSCDVAGILCELEIVAGPWATEDGFRYRLEPYMRFTVHMGGGEVMTYIVSGSWLDIEMVEDPYQPGFWVFKEIRETLKEPVAAGRPGRLKQLATEPSTYGSVKAMFK